MLLLYPFCFLEFRHMGRLQVKRLFCEIWNQEVVKETNDQSQRLVGDCFLYVRENVWRSVFTRKSCTWRLRGYSYIYRRDKPRLLITYPLFVVELWWPRDMFRRVHRSCIVNLRAVEGFIGKAICIADWVLPVSPLYREEVFGCFLFWELKRKKKVQ